MFADSVEYVDLEITNESMISRIGDIEITDSAIVVCDSRQGAVMLLTVSETSAAGSGNVVRALKSISRH